MKDPRTIPGTGVYREYQAFIHSWKETMECPDLFVYFVRSEGCGLIKIGQSVDPARRTAVLSYEYADDMTLLATIKAKRGDLEKRLHYRFSEFNIAHPAMPNSREWFEPARPILEYIIKYTPADMCDIAPRFEWEAARRQRLTEIEGRISALSSVVNDMIDNPMIRISDWSVLTKHIEELRTMITDE